MAVLFLLIPAALVLAGLGVLGFRWAVRSGQYDDVHTPAVRMLFDDETPGADEGLGERPPS